MPTIYELKPRFQALLRPCVQALARRGVTANQVTVSALVISVLAGGALALQPSAHPLLLLIPVVLFVRMALNAIDGMLAREHDMKTPLGAMLNELGDVFSDAALYLPFARLDGVSAPLVVLVVLLAMASEMAGVVGVRIGAQRRYDGPMGKSDRAFVFGLIATLLGLGVGPEWWVNVLLLAVSAALVATIVNRGRGALQQVS